VSVGTDIEAAALLDHDAVLLTIGSTKGRDVEIPGRELSGIHLAMEFLPQQNRRVSGKPVLEPEISAKGKNVVILGGGDTGSDCHGTSLRQGAINVYSFELMPKPPNERDDTMLWPMYPFIMKTRTSSSHEEGGQRDWSIATKSFSGENGQVKRLHAARLEWSQPDASGRRSMKEIPGSEFTVDCELVLLALGFVHPEHDIPTQLGLELDPRGNIKAGNDFRTSKPGVFAAGDARRGQSLVVWAIHEGREAARCIDIALMGHSDLPSATSHGYDSLVLRPTLQS
jgi:glutamate synthase (NADPH/NADH) small chain